MPEIIERVVEHECGWVSDGGAFPEGAGCPKCGERITADSLSRPRRPRRDVPSPRRDDLRPINLTNPDDLASLTVPEVVGFISDLPVGPELAEIELLEQAGENRKGVIAAIRDRLAKLKG